MRELTLTEAALQAKTSTDALRAAMKREALTVTRRRGRLFVSQVELERYIRRLHARDTR